MARHSDPVGFSWRTNVWFRKDEYDEYCFLPENADPERLQLIGDWLIKRLESICDIISISDLYHDGRENVVIEERTEVHARGWHVDTVFETFCIPKSVFYSTQDLAE